MDKLTRREIAAALSGSAVFLAAVAAPAQSENAGDELQASLAQLRGNAEQLDKFPLPMAAEPATIFKP